MSKSTADFLSKRNIFPFSRKYFVRFIMWSFFVWKANLLNKRVLLIWPKINRYPKEETAGKKNLSFRERIGGRDFPFSPLLLWCEANHQLLRAELQKICVQVGKEVGNVSRRFSMCFKVFNMMLTPQEQACKSGAISKRKLQVQLMLPVPSEEPRWNFIWFVCLHLTGSL